MKLTNIDPIIKAIEARQENAEDLPPLTTGDFLRMLREASEPEILTNLDRIRTMTTEELAEFLSELDIDEAGIGFCKADGSCPYSEGCYKKDEFDDCEYCRNAETVKTAQRLMWLDWLKMEWKGEQDE